MILVFRELNRCFILSFDNNDNRKVHTGYFPPERETKDHVMINGKNAFVHPVKNDMRTYDNVQKIATGLWNDDTNGCLLNIIR